MWKGETGRGGGGARKCWVKSDRNGIKVKLLVGGESEGGGGGGGSEGGED